MKKIYFPAVLFIATSIALTIMSFTDYSVESGVYKLNHTLNTSGAPGGRTGAPGESTCNECHSGTAQSGTGNNTVVLTDSMGVVTYNSYVPNRTYHVAVSFTSASSKNGFEIVALQNSGSAPAGTVTLIPSTGSKIVNGSAGKKYLTHTTAGTAQNSWEFNWTAPASNVGNITFYLATNETNNNNSSGGDKIRLSQHMYGSDAGITEKKNMDLTAGYNSKNNTLQLNYSTLASGNVQLNITDLSGKSVFTEVLGTATTGENEELVKLPAGFNAGIYIVHLSVDNNFAARKIYIGN